MLNNELYGKMVGEHSAEEIMAIGEWIKKNIRPSRFVSEYDSCALKQLLEIDTGICMTNDAVKEAMFLAGFRPECSGDKNWRFRIQLVREINENPNPFFNWLMGAEYADGTPEEDFISDIAQDFRFPVFADHGIIRGYLEDEDACEETIDVFENLWEKYKVEEGKEDGKDY